MFGRFLVYGFLGWGLEVLFTGLHAALLGKDRSATGKTYLWMHPIYGGAALALEYVSRKLDRYPATRPFAYVPLIYAVEYASGYALRRVLGRCPWDYGKNGTNLHGLIRFDYAPAWLAAAYLFDPIAKRVSRALEPVTEAVQAAGEAALHAGEAALHASGAVRHAEDAAKEAGGHASAGAARHAAATLAEGR